MNTETGKILVFVKDSLVRRLLDEGLRRIPNATVRFYDTGESLLDDARTLHENLRDRIVIVLGCCTGQNGEDLCKSLAQEPIITPVVLLTRAPDESYPFPRRDIFAMPVRMGALLDRVMRHLRQKPQASAIDIEMGPYVLRPNESLIQRRSDNKSIYLTEKERDMLLKFHQKKGEIIGRKELLDDIWGYGEGLETHTLETHIYRLRQKIEPNPAIPALLLTEENGYRFAL